MRLTLIAVAFFAMLCLSFTWNDQQVIPKVFTAQNIQGLLLPLADSTVSITHLPESLYYALPERVAYKSYPFYLPEQAPKGYYDWLMTREPELAFDPAQLKTDADWIRAGEIVYDLPEDLFEVDLNDTMMLHMLRQSNKADGLPLGKDGSLPFFRIYIKEKGKLFSGGFSCGECHTKVMPDGSLWKGAQGNSAFDQNFGNGMSQTLLDEKLPDSTKDDVRKGMLRGLFGAAWINDGLQQKMFSLSNEEVVKSLTNTYGGVMHRHGSVLGEPTSIPDLYNLGDRKYLDHTGLMLNRGIVDIMLYATLNQQADRYDKYNGKVVMAKWPNEGGRPLSRFSDVQLYALAKYLLSLKAPANPKKFPADQLARGEQLFKEQGCVTCHTPPLYTNNSLTPVDGFEVPQSHLERFEIFNVSVETNPGLALYSRRGTGYYKVPSLRGVWNRKALLHNGTLTSLDQLLDSARLKDDYVPAGYKPGWAKTYPVKGHPFGLELTTTEKQSLIAFLLSL